MEQKVISVLGPSGGVGKSTITKELAIAISATKVNDKNIKTCIIDANLVFGAQKAYFTILPKFTIEDWVYDYRKDKETLSYQELDVKYDWTQLEKYLFYSAEYGTYILPAPSQGHYFEIRLDEMDFFVNALRKYFDIILIDTGNNLESVTIAAMTIADINILIVTDETRSIDSAKKLRRLARELKIPLSKFMVVVNKYPPILHGRLYTKAELSTELYMDVSLTLPNERKTWKLNNAHIPIVTYKGMKLKKGLLRLANLLVPEVDPSLF